MQQCDRLSVQEWKEMKAPWKDSVRMDCAMSGILLLMAQLLKKELEERDRLCVGFMKLQQFTQESLRTNGIAAKQSAKVSGAEPVDARGTEIRSVGVGTNPTALVESEKVGWLFQKFRNPERPLISMKKGGFPVNGWNSCIRLWSWRDFRQEHLKRSAFLCRR